MVNLLFWTTFGILVYVMAMNLFYSVMLVTASRSMMIHGRRFILTKGAKSPPKFIKPFSILVPVHDEAMTVIESVRSFLAIDYDAYEVIVCNDGSSDETMDILKDTFKLVKIEMDPNTAFECKPIKNVYFSQIEPKLVVVDKENGGKADSQNAAVNVARYRYLCVVDADTLLDPKCLDRLALSFARDPDIVALGGIVRVINGCTVEGGKVTKVGMPGRLVEKMQVMEYLRAFLFGRVALSSMDVSMIISGAFGVFRWDAFLKMGGWNVETIGEDMDAVVRLHRIICEDRLPWKIAFVPDPVSWTQVPVTASSLAIQRERWQRGLMQVMFGNMRMFLNPRYGKIGLIGYPYFFIFEMLSAVVEFLCYPVTIACFLLGIVNFSYVLFFLAVTFIWGLCLSYTSIALQENIHFRYNRKADLWKLFGVGFLENFGYRQIHSFWRLKGLIKYMFIKSSRSSGMTGWTSIKREEF